MDREIKAITYIPGWVDQLATEDKISTSENAYALVPLIYRSINLISDALASVPIMVMRGEEEVDWPFECDPYDLMWKTAAALKLEGAAYWLKLANNIMVKDLQWINPTSVTVDYNEGWTFTQIVGGRTTGKWTDEEIVYFREYAPDQDTHPGITPVKAAINDIRLANYLSRFATYFFESGAMPVTLVAMPGQPTKDEIARTENFFRRMMTGIGKAFKVLGVREGTKIER